MGSCRPNRATGGRSRIVVQDETCWGEVAEDQQAIGVEYVSETLSRNPGIIESNLIRGDRMKGLVVQGKSQPGGEINGELQPHGFWPLVMHHVLGGDVTTVGSGPYFHSMEGAIALEQGMTIEKRFGFPDGTTFKRLWYLGSRVNRARIEIPTNGMITALADFMSKSEVESDVDLEDVPLYPSDNQPFTSFHGAILLDRAGDGTREMVATLKTWSIEINNNMAGEEFAIDGTRFRADLPEDLRIVNGAMTAFFVDDNWPLYESLMDDLALSMEVTITRGSFYWHFTVPAFKIRGNPTPQVGGRGPLDLTMEWEAARDDDTGTDVLLSIANNDPALATAE